MKDINVCIPVLKRYDMLKKLFVSLKVSRPKPTRMFIIDNGRNAESRADVMTEAPCDVLWHVPDQPLSVAESWNWFINSVPEERIISNDDVEFSHDSIGKMAAAQGDLVWAEGVGFSCFLIRDSCVEKLGLFDETISPGYGYYEDEDYLQRLDGRGTREPSAIAVNVDAGVDHFRSSTLAVNTPQEWEDHHRKFAIAQRNYMRKWGIDSL